MHNVCPHPGHSSVHAQVQAARARDTTRPVRGPVPDADATRGGGAQLLLPRDRVHHGDGLSEPTGRP